MPSAASPFRPAIAFVFSTVLLSSVVWTDGDGSYAVSINAATQPDLMQPDFDSDVAVVSLATVGFPLTSRPEMEPTESPDDAATPPEPSDASPVTEPPVLGNALTPDPIALWAGEDILRPMAISLTGANPIAARRIKAVAKFAAEYRSLLKLVAILDLPRIQDDAYATFIGTASTYNPYREGRDEGRGQTASGELYDAGAWTAAIQIGLRERFGGIRYGRLYQPVFVLVESGKRRAIVRINDVGPLKAERLIDLNERSMRHFDPFLTRGLVSDMKITLLPGNDWTPGPLGGAELISFASAQ